MPRGVAPDQVRRRYAHINEDKLRLLRAHEAYEDFLHLAQQLSINPNTACDMVCVANKELVHNVVISETKWLW